jgi:hypothetical protein
MQLPVNDGADGVGYGVDYPVFWIDRFHPHGVSSIRPSWQGAALRSTPSTRPP